MSLPRLAARLVLGYVGAVEGAAALIRFRELGMWILSTLHLLQFFATMVKRLIAFLREMSDAS